jgi:hypothetical protein
MFVDMVRKPGSDTTGSPATRAEPELPPATANNLAPSEVQDLKSPESKTDAAAADNAAVGEVPVSEDGKGVRSGGGEGFSERVVGEGEAVVEFEGQVVACLRDVGGGEPGLSMLKGRMSCPMDGLVQSIERAKLLLRGQWMVMRVWWWVLCRKRLFEGIVDVGITRVWRLFCHRKHDMSYN